jgi:hypothetical protein
MGRKKAEFHRHTVKHSTFKVNATCIFGWRLNPFYQNQMQICCLAVIGSVVVVVFQSIFHLKIHQNNIYFLILKNYF